MTTGRAALLGAAILVACNSEPPASATARANKASGPAPHTDAPSPEGGAQPPASSSAPAPIVGPQTISDPDESYLATADVVSITPVRGPLARGTFEALLAAPEGRRAATIAIALTAAPTAYQRPLAYARLARALGARVVPKSVLRPMAAGDLAAIAGDAGDATAIVREARVLNDGTVDVLVSARSTEHAGSAWAPADGRIIDPTDAREMTTWERWASSPEPAQGEDLGLLRDYLEMVVLDYLAANDARRRAILTGRSIVLADNASAFPPHPSPAMLDRALRRLRAAERYPRGLRAALLAFDKDRAAATFAPGGFSTWILTPRARVDLDERRAAVLTLLEAKIAARGEAAVLSL